MVTNIEKDVRELKRRVDLAETRLSQLEGQFGFISGQLRDIQLYMHARFDDLDSRLDHTDLKLGGVVQKVDLEHLRADLPEIVASAVGTAIREHD